MERVVFLDYNDTIVLSMEKSMLPITKAFFPIEEFIPKTKGKGGSPITPILEYVDDDSKELTYSQVNKFFDNFEKNSIYPELFSGNKNIENFLIKKKEELKKYLNEEENKSPLTQISASKKPKNAKDFLFNDLIFPLIAKYNVHFSNVRPQETFKQFFEENNKDGTLMLINTGGPEEIVKNEMREFIELDPEKYGYLEYFLKNDLIFGTNINASKKEYGRVNSLLEVLKYRGFDINENTMITLVGDTEKDIKNYDEIDNNLYPNKEIFILKERLENVDDLNERKRETEECISANKKIIQILENDEETEFSAKRVQLVDNLKSDSEKLKEEKKILEKARKLLEFYMKRKANIEKELEEIEKRGVKLGEKEEKNPDGKHVKFVRNFAEVKKDNSMAR